MHHVKIWRFECESFIRSPSTTHRQLKWGHFLLIGVIWQHFLIIYLTKISTRDRFIILVCSLGYTNHWTWPRTNKVIGNILKFQKTLLSVVFIWMLHNKKLVHFVHSIFSSYYVNISFVSYKIRVEIEINQ